MGKNRGGLAKRAREAERRQQKLLAKLEQEHQARSEDRPDGNR